MLPVLMFPEKFVKMKIVAYCKAAFLVTGLKNRKLNK